MTKDEQIELLKIAKHDIGKSTERLKALPKNGERNIAITKLQEALTWIAVDLNHQTE